MSRDANRPPRKSALLGRVTPLEDRVVPATAFLLQADNSIVSFDTTLPGTLSTPVAVTGLGAGENLVGIDFRPQNGFLYGLASSTGSVRLYAISTRTGVASPLTAAPVQFSTIAGGVTTPVAVTGTSFGFDFNPTVDRIRVTTDTGFNFRMNPNTGALIDSDGDSANGVQPDAAFALGGADGAAYTNSSPNATATTLYHLNAATNFLFIQNPPNSGNVIAPQTVTLGGQVLDFSGVNGFDIPASVAVATSNAGATGRAFAALTVDEVTKLYGIDLATAAATDLGTLGTGTAGFRGLAIQDDRGGFPAVGLSADGTQLVRFNTATPGTATAATVTGVTAGETLAGIAWRPQNGQLFGLGVNGGADTATLYRIDPQTGAATAIGTPGQVTYTTDGTTKVDLPVASAGYGFDFNPTVDRIRITAAGAFNARANPDTGAPVDGSATTTGVNPDGSISNAMSPPTGALPVAATAAAYTNSFGQTLGAGGPTTLYHLDDVTDSLFIQSPPNSGTVLTALPVKLNGNRLDFTAVNGFAIPAGIRVATSNDAASGRAIATLTVGGSTGVYAIELATGAATLLGPVAPALAAGSAGLALGDATPLKPAAGPFLAGGQTNGTARQVTGSGGTFALGSTVTFPGLTGQVRVAVADINGDGTPDYVGGAGPGGTSKVVALDGKTNAVLFTVTAFESTFTGGVFVAAGDLDGDGKAEVVVTPDQGGGPVVAIYRADGSQVDRFFGIEDPNFRGGARAAVGDISGDGRNDLAVAAGFGGGPRLALFDGIRLFDPRATATALPPKLLPDFFVFESTLRNGVFVAVGDLTADGAAELVVGGGPGGGPRVFALDGRALLGGTQAVVANFFAGDPNSRGGIRLAIRDADGDGRSDLLTGSGDNEAARVRAYPGTSFPALNGSEPAGVASLEPFDAVVLPNGVFVG